jgi:uncharacterized short protein YbdD (DUF466 family)
VRKVQSKATSLLRGGWVWLRQVSGDAAYENYLRSAASHPDSGSPLSRAEFYLDSVRRRYSTVSRCC